MYQNQSESRDNQAEHTELLTEITFTDPTKKFDEEDLTQG